MKDLELKHKKRGIQHLILDDEDYEKIKNKRIYLHCNGKHIYARISIDKKYIFLHRIITKAPQYMVIDHVNGNGLDNRKSNLRICTMWI